MKTRLYIIILASGFLGACSGSMMLSTGYDDIYYSPGDEPVQTVVKRSAAPLDNAYSAMEFADAGTTEKGLNVYQTDTLQADAYYEAGDSSMIVNNYYENSGYDNYGGIPYSSRIRRFYGYSPSFSYFSPYYSSFYNPFSFGLYSGYNMFSNRYNYGSPYNGYGYGYDPYYYDSFYPGSYYYGSYGSRYRSPYSYYSYGGYPNYYNSDVYYRNSSRSDDVYVGQRRSGTTNRNVMSTIDRSKSNYANYKEANRRTNANSSGRTSNTVATNRNTTNRNTTKVSNNNPANRRGTSTNRVTTTTRVPQKNSTVNTNRRSSTYTPSYNNTRTSSKPVYNRSTRTYQGSSSNKSTTTSKSVYSKPRSTNRSTYSRPVSKSSGSSGTSYSGSSRSSSSSYSRSSGSSGSSSSRSSSSSSRSSGGGGRR